MDKKINFEESMNRLNEIVSLLEKNEASLDESIGYFEEGIKLAGVLDKQLKEYENKISEIVESNKEQDDE